MEGLVPEKAVSEEVLSEGERSPILNPFPRNAGKVDYSFPKDSQGDMLENIKLNDLEGARALVKSNIGMTVTEASECLMRAFKLDMNSPEFVRLLLGLGASFNVSELESWLKAQLATLSMHPDVMFVLNQYLKTNEIVEVLETIPFDYCLAFCQPEFSHHRQLYEALGVILEEQIERELKAKNWDMAMSHLLQALGFSVGRFELPIRKSALERWLPLLNAMPVESLELLRMPNSEGRTLLSHLQQFDLRKFPNLVVREQSPLDPSTANFPEYLREALRSKESLEVYVRHLESRDVGDIRTLLKTPDADGYLALYYILHLIPDLKRYRQIEGVVGEMFASQLATKDALEDFLWVKGLENDLEQALPQVVAVAVAAEPKKLTVKDAEAAFTNAIANLDLNDKLPLDLETVKKYLTLIDEDYIFVSSAGEFLLQRNAKGFSLLYYLQQIRGLGLGAFVKKISHAVNEIYTQFSHEYELYRDERNVDKVEDTIKQGRRVNLVLALAVIDGHLALVERLAKYAVVHTDVERMALLKTTITEKSSADCVMALVKTGHFTCDVNTLFFAVRMGSVELTEMLLAPPYNLSPYAKNADGDSLVDFASSRAVRNLLEEKAAQMSTPEKLVAQRADSPTRSRVPVEGSGNNNNLGPAVKRELNK